MQEATLANLQRQAFRQSIISVTDWRVEVIRGRYLILSVFYGKDKFYEVWQCGEGINIDTFLEKMFWYDIDPVSMYRAIASAATLIRKSTDLEEINRGL